VHVDPRRPTRHHPGSEEKLIILQARAERKLPLFLAGDAEGARQVQNPQPNNIGRMTPVEMSILGVIGAEEESIPELAQKCGYSPSYCFAEALRKLECCGKIIEGVAGWRRT